MSGRVWPRKAICFMVTRRKGEGGLWSLSFLLFILFGLLLGLQIALPTFLLHTPLLLLHTPLSQTHSTPEGGFPSLPVTSLSIQVDGQIITDGFGLWVPQGKGAREVQ